MADASVTKRTFIVGLAFSNAAANSGATAVKSAAAATVRLFWANKRPLASKKHKVNGRQLDNLALIFNNNSVLRAAGYEILRPAEAKRLL
jgi:hypothetical protein